VKSETKGRRADASAAVEGDAAGTVRAPSAPRKTATPRTRAAGAPTRPKSGRRSPEELQARILAAAIAEFAEHSFSGARIERISKRAKTVDRMLYYYFGSKERLYQSALEHAYSDLIEAQRALLPNDDPVRGMRELVEHSFRHYADHPEIVRLIVTENLLRAKYLKKSTRIRRTTMPLLQTVKDLLAAGQRQGLFRPDADAERVLMTIMSLGFFYVSNQYSVSLWLSADLMEAGRQAAWLEHIGNVVLQHLAVPDR
jgi:AcrR family transcriptional regulator